LVIAGGALVLGCGGADLIDPPSGVTVYQLRDVDGEGLPVPIDSLFVIGGIQVHILEDAEMVLLADSVAELWTRIRWRGPLADTVRQGSTTGRYWIDGDTVLVWCPIFGPGGAVCSGDRYDPDESIVRWLFGSGRQRDHRFTRR
jgi:hypothetical protein